MHARATRKRRLSLDRLEKLILEVRIQEGAPYHTTYPTRKVFSLLRDADVRSITELEKESIFDRIRDVLSRRTPTPKSSTIECWIARLSTLMRWSYERGFLRALPRNMPRQSAHRKRPRSDRSLPPSTNEVGTLFEYLRDCCADWFLNRLYVLVAVIVYAGMTLRAALRVTVQSVDLERSIIRESGRDYAITPELAAILRDWIVRLRWTDCDLLIPGDKQLGPWHTPRMHDALAIVLESARLRPITFEQLRRYHVERPRHADFGFSAGRTDECLIAIGEFGEPVLVSGIEVEGLSEYRHALIKLIVDAGRGGISPKEIGTKFTKGGWWQVLSKMISTPPWKGAILPPGGPYGNNWRAVWTSGVREVREVVSIHH